MTRCVFENIHSSCCAKKRLEARLYREASIGKKKWEPRPENGSDDGEEWMNGRDIKMEKAAQF